jgi:tryptophan-rich sensory protein
VGLKWGALSLVSTIEELLGRKRSCSGLQNREYGRRGFVTLATWYPLSAISRHLLHRLAAVVWSIQFDRGHRPHSLVVVVVVVAAIVVVVVVVVALVVVAIVELVLVVVVVVVVFHEKSCHFVQLGKPPWRHVGGR